ncbi:MAG: cyanoexosortase A [Cyanobacteriota bacterium]|nr:cyanoexosortase A [Cyanobacteriota bacterium]
MDMNAISPVLFQRIKTSPFWLLTIGSGLMAIHLALVWRADNPSILGTGILFWAAVSSMVWQRRYDLKLESGVFASIVGFLLIAVILIRSAAIPLGGNFFDLIPVLSGLGLGLLASGFRGLRQYWAELIALFFIGAPRLIEPWIVDISPITAKFSAFILWYSGFEAQLNGVYISLPTGTVEVYSGCSGIDTMIHVFGIALLFLITFPTNWIQKVFVPFVALTIGFIVNGFRVMLLAIIVAQNNTEAFDYWHHRDGSFLFSLIAVLLFGGFCWFLLQLNDRKPEEAMEGYEG